MNHYKDILEEILEYDEKFVVIWGCCDIITDGHGYKRIKDIQEDSFWRVIGRGDDKDIIESLKEEEIKVDSEGEYEIKAIMKWESSEYDFYGRVTYPGGLVVEFIEFKFIQTFTERERDSKLDILFDIDLF
jgi:hypothetical protein